MNDEALQGAGDRLLLLDGAPTFYDIIPEHGNFPPGLTCWQSEERHLFTWMYKRPSRECALHEAGRSVRAEFGHISMGAVVSSVTYAFPWLSTPIAVPLNAVSGKKARR